MIDISVIIPVWNTPKEYLQACCESISKNNCAYEIIFVDDGSNQSTREYLRNLESNRIHIFFKKHEGISKARNYGLKQAKGKYITHADSDDYFVPGILDRILQEFQNLDTELIIGMISRNREVIDSDEDNEINRITSKINETLFRELRIYYTNMNNPMFKYKTKWVNRAPHARFMSRKLALETPFREEIPYCEDVIWNFDLLNNAQSVAVISLLSYYYIDVPLSNTQKFRPDSREEINVLLSYYYKEIKHWPVEDRPQFEVISLAYFSMLMRVYVFSGAEKDRKTHYWEMICDPLWRKVFRSVQLHRLSGTSLLAGVLGKIKAYHIMYVIYTFRYLGIPKYYALFSMVH